MERHERQAQDAGEEQDRQDGGDGRPAATEDDDPTTQPIQAPEGERGAEAEL